MVSDFDLLSADYRTLFVIDADDRIICENDPDKSAGPLCWLASCASGCLCGVQITLDEQVAQQIARLHRLERPQHNYLDCSPYIDLLTISSGQKPIVRREVIYQLPQNLRRPTEVELVHSESETGQALHERLVANGIPSELTQMGFRDIADLWAPWCAAIVDGVPVALAFSARLSAIGAELGLVTAQAFRGQGIGSAVTAGWSRIPSLQIRHLFYTSDAENASSLRVAEHLGLRRIGSSVRLETRVGAI